MRRFAVAALMAVLVHGATTAHAQTTSRAAVEVSGAYAMIGGDAFGDTDDGVGFNAKVLLALSSRLSIGAGYVRTEHSVPALPEDISMTGIYLGGRYMLAMDGRFQPFLGGRIGLLNKGTEILVPLTGPVEGESRGTMVGINAGTTYSITSLISALLSAGFDQTFFGDTEYRGEPFADTGASGSVITVRLGVRIGFGSVR